MKEAFEKALFFEISQWENSKLREAAQYAIEGEAKRIRPIIALMIAKELDVDYANYHPMIALELAHTSSLILDDLPCMDNATLRRNKKALHLCYNEQEALLVAVGLISESFMQLRLGADKLKDCGAQNSRFDILSQALKYTASAGGLSGAPLGQWMDLTISSTNTYPLELLMQKKTGVFFESAFILGWLFGNGALERLPQVVEAANVFGILFQVMDDFIDLQEDALERPFANFVLKEGVTDSLDYLEKQKERLSALLEDLCLFKLRQALLEPLEHLLSMHRSTPCC